MRRKAFVDSMSLLECVGRDLMVTSVRESRVTAHAACHRTVARAVHDARMLREAVDTLWVEHLPAARRSRRIAVVTETYPPEVNGVAMSMQRVVEELHRRQHDLQLIRPRQRAGAAAGEARFDEVLTGGWPIPLYPDMRMGVPSKRALVRLWSLRRPDVVHVATEGPLGWSALAAARHLSLPVTSDYRTNFHAYGRHYKVGWLARPIMGYLRKFHNRANVTMVPTEALRTELSARGFERLEVVGRGVDLQRFDPRLRSEALRASWGARPDTLVAICVGRLAPEKNLGAALAAFEALRRKHADARLLFVGDGPQRAELQARCPEAVFAGQRGGSDLAAHYASADLFLFPSLTETFGNVTAEAMASGLAVAAFDSAAASTLIDSGRSGVLADDDSEVAFVRAALRAADPACRKTLGVAARERARSLNWSEVATRFESILEHAIEAQAVAALAPPMRLRRQAV
jgi:glycosyltransferase involved in cell wall biosynthesis